MKGAAELEMVEACEVQEARELWDGEEAGMGNGF